MAFRVFFNLVFHTVELFIYVSISLSLLSIVLSFFVCCLLIKNLSYLFWKFYVSLLNSKSQFSLCMIIYVYNKGKKKTKNIDTKVENKTMKKFSGTTL